MSTERSDRVGDEPEGDNSGVLIGAVVGGVAFLLLLVAIIVVCVVRKKKQSRASVPAPTATARPAGTELKSRQSEYHSVSSLAGTGSFAANYGAAPDVSTMGKSEYGSAPDLATMGKSEYGNAPPIPGDSSRSDVVYESLANDKSAPIVYDAFA